MKLVFLFLRTSPTPVQALLELVFGVKVVITGDGFIPGEHSVIIMNHRTHLDWMFLWFCLLRYSYLRLEKIYLKVGIGNIRTHTHKHVRTHTHLSMGYTVLHLHQASVGGGPQPHGEHAGILL